MAALLSVEVWGLWSFLAFVLILRTDFTATDACKGILQPESKRCVSSDCLTSLLLLPDPDAVVKRLEKQIHWNFDTERTSVCVIQRRIWHTRTNSWLWPDTIWLESVSRWPGKPKARVHLQRCWVAAVRHAETVSVPYEEQRANQFAITSADCNNYCSHVTSLCLTVFHISDTATTVLILLHQPDDMHCRWAITCKYSI